MGKTDMILVIGGAPEFSDYEQALKGIDSAVAKVTDSPKNIKVVYGIGETKVSGQGGYFYAQQWAEINKVMFRDGSPKFYNADQTFNKDAVAKRNKILAEHADAMVLLMKGTSTGGNSIVDAFEEKGILVERVVQEVAKISSEQAIEVYSKVAKNLLANSVTLDVETTGLNEAVDDVVEIAVVDSATGEELYNSFIFTETPIGEGAAAVNQITPEMLDGMPKLAEAWQTISEKIGSKIIVASNSRFDERMVCFGLHRQGVETPSNLWTCLQELYCKYSQQPRKGLNTARIAQQLGIEPGTHRALTDATAQTLILKAMAEGIVPNREI